MPCCLAGYYTKIQFPIIVKSFQTNTRLDMQCFGAKKLSNQIKVSIYETKRSLQIKCLRVKESCFYSCALKSKSRHSMHINNKQEITDSAKHPSFILSTLTQPSRLPWDTRFGHCNKLDIKVCRAIGSYNLLKSPSIFKIHEFIILQHKQHNNSLKFL